MSYPERRCLFARRPPAYLIESAFATQVHPQCPDVLRAHSRSRYRARISPSSRYLISKQQEFRDLTARTNASRRASLMLGSRCGIPLLRSKSSGISASIASRFRTTFFAHERRWDWLPVRSYGATSPNQRFDWNEKLDSISSSISCR
jgi:hypothetical protein